MKNGFIYVGSTSKELQDRLREHLKPSTHKKNPNNLMYKDMEEQDKEDFVIELLDTCFERHRFIIEEYWYNKLYASNYLMYDIKRGATHSQNTKQRIAESRNNRPSEIYNSDNFKEKISEVTKGEKNGMWGKKGENAINGRMVIAYTDEQCTNLFKVFPSVREACKFLETKGHSSLNAACRENLKYRGYYWKKEWRDNRERKQGVTTKCFYDYSIVKREDSGEIPLSVVLPPF